MNRTAPQTRERSSGRPQPKVLRRRAAAAGALALAVVVVIAIVLLAAAGSPARRTGHGGVSGGRDDGPSRGAGGNQGSSRRVAGPGVYAVGLRVLQLTDPSRSITLPDGASEPRPLVTEVFYPALAAPGSSPASVTENAAPATADGPFPLVVFGHGFAVTPKLYAQLLQAWARAGYVVAAPVFPLENAEAPGGPDESDLVNQPADMSFVISRMLALSRAASGPLAGLIAPSEIAVTGQSDGGDTALAVAYDAPYRDPRVDAAIILSGAEIPALGSFTFPQGGPPLLATQGSADTVNPPSATEAYFSAAQRPKFLLDLIGAEHLPPYSTQQPQLTIVEHVTLAFLDHYLKNVAGALQRMQEAGNVPGTATMLVEP
jgi:dienelactone hydrolase